MVFFVQKSLKKILFFAFILSFFLLDFCALEVTAKEDSSQMSEIDSQWCHDFLLDLKYGQRGEEIKFLQIALEKEGLFKGPASGYFDLLTLRAVRNFQEKYKNEVLSPFGFKKGTGFVGIATRTKLNELYGCTKITLSSLSPQTGDPLILKIKTKSPKIEGRFGSEKIDFFKFDESFVGVLGISVKKKPGRYTLSVSLPEGEIFRKNLTLIKRKFPITELPVTKEYTPSRAIEVVNKTSLILKNIFSIYTKEVYFDKPFVYPLEKVEISGFSFGELLRFKNTVMQHVGVDLKGSTSTPVYAINDGKVVFAEDLGNYGNTIIIDHGFGIFSLYCHLNEFKVSKEERVKRGQMIGVVGETGYATGPHLHFSINVKGVSVDPLRFIEMMKNELTMIEGMKAPLDFVNKILPFGHYKPLKPRPIDTIVIHSSYNAIGKDPYSIEGIIQECKIYGVLPHYLIARDGTIYLLAPEEDIAYHAGESKMPDGRTEVNDFSIGIELIYPKNESPTKFNINL
jgi:hypothetical protein